MFYGILSVKQQERLFRDILPFVIDEVFDTFQAVILQKRHISVCLFVLLFKCYYFFFFFINATTAPITAAIAAPPIKTYFQISF